MKIAIDGTASSGKGTLGKNLAEKFNYDYLDTGKLYRLTALKIHNSNISDVKFLNKKNIEDIISNIDFTKLHSTELIQPHISDLSSKIAKIEFIRSKLLVMQREFAKNPPGGNGVILDGRDIGSFVLPDADIKFFVDAKLTIRAKRRYQEYIKNGIIKTYKDVFDDLKIRDKRDKNRKISPLIITNDAFLIDSSNRNAEEVLQEAVNYLKKFKFLYKN